MSGWVAAGAGPGPCALASEAKRREEVADEKRERDDEAYAEMLKTVAEEWAPEYAPFRPDGRKVHEEAMRRLRVASESS